ncbi:glycosyltransferase family 8 protein [Caldibacillus debilis]|jgi:lipopolysaccharide biosynthesis glycosyltransferase|uniref:Lipopolysaccharide biosynthesis protein, LPS:glycosyltransferase n=2 Tax=Caldibacillus debilis TaxID=301148 RepID=A0A420VIA0_9BACI|nr:glycosyltransferase family 8 protein [Caldibacillus debilis]MBO2481417.1 glycosyltransferase family 8 protein [Bacillaceae bacterium]RKO63128.1 Lipopolysaccharide biosynthesis protein, LPS:glycosyltransferase [Caldibacillus debilis GB1]
MLNILVTVNSNYIPPLKVMLNSLFLNNRQERFAIYLLYSNIKDEEIKDLLDFVEGKGQRLHPIAVDPKQFEDAPVFRHYTVEMYYRLAAHLYLPEEIDRILYLDPDIVVINPIKELYEMDFDGCLFIAAEHEHTTKVARPFNKLRLGTPNAKGYFNTGVLLMNLQEIRKNVDMQKIYRFIEENKLLLFLPDQDVLNALFWDKIKPVDAYRYNYDARYYELGKLLPKFKYDLDWMKKNTVFIHFCGKEKPWQEKYKGELGKFYKEYERLL